MLTEELNALAQSAKAGDANAAARINLIGYDYQTGSNGKNVDQALAYELYTIAAECGDFNGMANAGYCVSNGIGVEKDVNKAFEYYKQAAELGHWAAMSNLGGWCYLYGNGTDKDVDKAIYWLTRAANEGNNIWSMNKLTYIYGELDGCINQELAAKWFLELIKRDSDPNSGVYGNTGYNKELYAKIKSAVLNSTTEEDMMSAMSGSNGGSLLGGAMSFTTSNAKSYINQAEEAIQRNIAYKAEQSQRAEEEDARRKAEEERARQEALRNEQEKQEREAWEARKKEIDRLLRELSSEEYHNIAVEDWKKIDYISVGIKWSELKRFMEDDSVQINRVDEIIKELEKENKIRKLVEEDCPYGLKEIAIGDFTIPVGTKRIGDQAFSDCIQLTSITIPDSVTCIEDSAFWNCVSLTDVKLPDSVVEFGGLVFQGCDSLTTPVYNAHIFAFLPDSYSEYAIPDGITTISSGAFWGWSLKSLRLPSSVTRIGWYAFKGVFSLRGIYVPKGKKALISRLLDGCEMNTEPEIIEE